MIWLSVLIVYDLVVCFLFLQKSSPHSHKVIVVMVDEHNMT